MSERAPSRYLNWCRVKGHLASCNCEYNKPLPEWLVEVRQQGAKIGDADRRGA